MTDQGDNSTDTNESKQQRWFADVQDALDRTGDALRTAWDATRDSRMAALESAKQAAQELGEVIDQGITAAKERWAAVDEGDETSKPSVVEDVVPEEPIVVEAEPTPPSGDVTVIPIETDTTDQS